MTKKKSGELSGFFCMNELERCSVVVVWMWVCIEVG